MTKTYEFKYDKRAGGKYTELNDNGNITIVDRGFNPQYTSEIETKKAEYEAQGYTEKISGIRADIKEALNACETEEEKKRVMDATARSLTR